MNSSTLHRIVGLPLECTSFGSRARLAILLGLVFARTPANAQKETATIAVGSNPFTVAVNPATNKVYVVNGGSNSVTVIDGATNATATVPVGSDPVD